MARKPPGGRGRPPIFVRDDNGRIIYGLSAQTIIKGGRRRTRFYATFRASDSDPRKWFGMDDLAGAVEAFFDWVNANGWTVAYLRKIGQSFLVPRLRQMHPLYTGRDCPESESIPDWLQGRVERGCPMGAVSITARRAFFLPLDVDSIRNDEADLQTILGDLGKSLTRSTKQILAELMRVLSFKSMLGRPQVEWVDEARRQLRESTRLTDTRIEALLTPFAEWRPRW